MVFSNLKSLAKNLIPVIPVILVLVFTQVTNVSADCSLGSQGSSDNPLGQICPPNGIPTEASQVAGIVTLFIKILFFGGFILAFIWLLLGGISYITSNGEPAKTAAAQKKIIYAVVGLIVIILAFSVLTLVEKVFSLSAGSITNPVLPF